MVMVLLYEFFELQIVFLVSYFFGVHVDLQYFFEVSVPFDLFSTFLIILIFSWRYYLRLLLASRRKMKVKVVV